MDTFVPAFLKAQLLLIISEFITNLAIEEYFHQGVYSLGIFPSNSLKTRVHQWTEIVLQLIGSHAEVATYEVQHAGTFTPSINLRLIDTKEHTPVKDIPIPFLRKCLEALAEILRKNNTAPQKEVVRYVFQKFDKQSELKNFSKVGNLLLKLMSLINNTGKNGGAYDCTVELFPEYLYESTTYHFQLTVYNEYHKFEPVNGASRCLTYSDQYEKSAKGEGTTSLTHEEVSDWE